MKVLYVGCPVRVVSTEHHRMSDGSPIETGNPNNPTGKTGVIIRRIPTVAQCWGVRLNGIRFTFWAESWELEPILPEGLLEQIKAEEKEDESAPEKVP